MRGHTPVTIEDFKGLWHRGNQDECPLDHSNICRNVQFRVGRVLSRQKWGLFVANVNQPVRRSFVYNADNGDTHVIFITYAGDVYTQRISPVLDSPIFRLATSDTTDIDVVSFNNRAYIAFANDAGYLGTGLWIFDGTVFKVAGYPTPGFSASMAGVAGGNIDAGVHYIGFAVETKTGFISKVQAVSPYFLTMPANQKISIAGLPDPTLDPNVASVRIIATKVIPGTAFPNNGLETHPSFFVPGGANGGVITSGTSTTINFYDSELLNSASYLQDVISQPPGGSFVAVYHNRLVVGAAPISSVFLIGETRHRLMVSRVNDPETFETTDSLLLVDPSTDSSIRAANGEVLSTGLTDGNEYRDTLYVAKLNSMYGISDNGDVPASWPIAKIDDGNGSFLHGIITVLDSGGINVEYMLIANKSGVFVFSGIFNFPEVTWKISDFWKTVTKYPYKFTQGGNLAPAQAKNHFVNDPYNKVLYLLICENSSSPSTIFYCDYSETNVSDPQYFMNVKWSSWHDTDFVRPSSMFAFDTGLGTRLFTFNSIDGQLWELGISSSTVEIIPSDFSIINTAFIKDPGNMFIHCNGYSLMQAGSGVADTIINSSLITRGSMATQVIPPVIVPANWFLGEKIVLSNHTSQAFVLSLQADYLDIRRINIYVKPTFRTIPQ